MANYFKGAKEFTINGGTFGQDYSRHSTYHGPVHRTNDYSKHTTNYGGYVNHGQHASGGGTINNNAPQMTNNGPNYGYQQYAGSRGGNRRRLEFLDHPFDYIRLIKKISPRPPSPGKMISSHILIIANHSSDMDDEFKVPLSRSGQQSRRRYPPQDADPRYGRDSDRNVHRDDYDESSKLLFNNSLCRCSNFVV
jgi:hypothetical protein